MTKHVNNQKVGKCSNCKQKEVNVVMLKGVQLCGACYHNYLEKVGL